MAQAYLTTFMVRPMEQNHKTGIRTAKLYFPLDMLRYDSCYPAHTEDALRIGNEMRDHWSVRLHKISNGKTQAGTLTDARWHSFGWEVVEGTVSVRKL